MAKRKYGTPSIKMLQFLWDNPGASSGEINKELHKGNQLKMRKITFVSECTGKHSTYIHDSEVEYYTSANRFKDIVLGELEMVDSYKVIRGKYSYLTTPYYSKALAGNRMGSIPHPRCERRTGNRGWFYREKGENGRFKYYITTRGYAYLWGEAIPLDLLNQHNLQSA